MRTVASEGSDPRLGYVRFSIATVQSHSHLSGIVRMVVFFLWAITN